MERGRTADRGTEGRRKPLKPRPEEERLLIVCAPRMEDTGTQAGTVYKSTGTVSSSSARPQTRAQFHSPYAVFAQTFGKLAGRADDRGFRHVVTLVWGWLCKYVSH